MKTGLREEEARRSREGKRLYSWEEILTWKFEREIG